MARLIIDPIIGNVLSFKNYKTKSLTSRKNRKKCLLWFFIFFECAKNKIAQNWSNLGMKTIVLIAKTMGYFIVILVVVLIIALIVATLSDFRLAGRIMLTKDGVEGLPEINTSELTLLTWNIGYAGLGKEMDFFYEGGKQVRPSREYYSRCFDGIQDFIETSRHTSFILLQEVDVKAKRSFWINQVGNIGRILGNHTLVFAKNYDVPFVPLPFAQPMGSVLSGLTTFSLYSPATAERVGFPSDMGWPNSLFLPDRCYLIQRFVTANGKVLVLINTHNSAFDNGERRKQQLGQLKTEALKEFQNGNYVIVGGDWNLNPPLFDTSQIVNGDKALVNAAGCIGNDLLPSDWTWAYDKKTPTNRWVNIPYSRGETQTTTIDFFLLSPNIDLMEVNTVDLNFEHSDHNPVKIKITLK